jgi:hypothetical protein
MAVSDRSAAGCWLGFTAAGWTSVFQILEQVSTEQGVLIHSGGFLLLLLVT